MFIARAKFANVTKEIARTPVYRGGAALSLRASKRQDGLEGGAPAMLRVDGDKRAITWADSRSSSLQL